MPSKIVDLNEFVLLTLSEIVAFRPLTFVAVAVTDMSLPRGPELIQPEIHIMSAPSFPTFEEIR